MLLPWLIFILIVGACVGSFVNVVTLRLPEGKSIVTPPSACPECGHELAWYDNLPVVGWLLLRGRCRYCGEPISLQYPLVEAVMALLFAGLFAVYYVAGIRPGFAFYGLGATWPLLALHLVLLASLVAATVIDARLYIIPLQIPWLVTLVALIGLPLMVAVHWQVPHPDLVPRVFDPAAGGAVVGGIIGLGVALGLLRSNLLPRSFDQVEDEVTEPVQSDAFLDHPHPRREVSKELLFVALPVIGAVIGGLIAPGWGWPYAEGLSTMLGVAAGYLVGGGFIWGTRILGTLGFGKEAMGLGDVHLLAAIGAVLGPGDAIYVFFIAPFIGLLATLVLLGLSKLLQSESRVIPYGPYLAGAALIVMIFHHPLHALYI